MNLLDLEGIGVVDGEGVEREDGCCDEESNRGGGDGDGAPDGVKQVVDEGR